MPQLVIVAKFGVTSLLANYTVKWGNFGQFLKIFLYISIFFTTKRFLFQMYNNDSAC